MAPIDRKGRDVRQGKHDDRLRRDRALYENDRLISSLEAGASEMDLRAEIDPGLSDYEARHLPSR